MPVVTLTTLLVVMYYKSDELKILQSLSDLGQVKNFYVSCRLLSWASNNQVSFWSLANKITCKKDLEDINRY